MPMIEDALTLKSGHCYEIGVHRKYSKYSTTRKICADMNHRSIYCDSQARAMVIIPIALHRDTMGALRFETLTNDLLSMGIK